MISSSEQYQTSIVGKARRIYIRAVVDISDPDMEITGVEGSQPQIQEKTRLLLAKGRYVITAAVL